MPTTLPVFRRLLMDTEIHGCDGINGQKPMVVVSNV